MSDQSAALYRLGDEGVAVTSIRALLHTTGDLAPSLSPPATEPDSAVERSDVFDEDLARAVRAFQQRRGL